MVGDPSVGAVDAVFVARARRDAGYEHLPHPGRSEPAHRCTGSAPAVEIAEDGHAARIRRPYRERRAGDLAVEGGVAARMGAEYLPEPPMSSFAEQVQIEFADGRQEAVSVGGQHGPAARIRHDQAVVPQIRKFDHALEDPVADGAQRMVDAADARRHRIGMGAKGSDHRTVRMRMRAEDRVRVGVGTGGQQHQIAPIHRRGRRAVVRPAVTGRSCGRPIRCARPRRPPGGRGCERARARGRVARNWFAPSGIPRR